MVYRHETSIDRDIGGLVDAGVGVYVHWPFCLSKCPYCGFNSHISRDIPDQEVFAAAVESEIKYMASRTSAPRFVSSVFMGGGTPSLMAADTVSRILSAIAKAWTMPDGIEITLEANPNTAEVRKFRDYRIAGVNRLSLGVQALEQEALKKLGRMHSLEEALQAIDTANSVFSDVSFDLIYARPGQTLMSWQRELEFAMGLVTNHLSAYQLTIDPGTSYASLYASGKLIMPSDEVSADMFDMTRSMLSQRGLPAYEISNHAVSGFESLHNLNYWRCGEYVGVGPGAHSRVNNCGQRYAIEMERSPAKWFSLVRKAGNGLVVDEALSEIDQARELILMGMRLTEGVNWNRHENRFRKFINRDKYNFLIEQKLIEITPSNHMRATESGVLVLDKIISELLD